MLYQLKLIAYQARKHAWKQRRVLLAGAALLVGWIALNETFAIKLIFEQECLDRRRRRHFDYTFQCLFSTRQRWFHWLSESQAAKLYLDITSYCRNEKRVGHWQEGGWDLCADEFPPNHHEQPGQTDYSCIVYSFGISNDASFDVDLTKTFGRPQCTIYAFDPSIGRQTGDTFLGDNIHFYNIGLGGGNYTRPSTGWDMMDLESIMSMLGHSHVDLIKMDIEGSEWEVFTNWKEHDSILNRFDQLLAELHFLGHDSADNVASLQWLRQEGFQVFSRRENFRFGHLKKHSCSRKQSCARLSLSRNWLDQSIRE